MSSNQGFEHTPSFYTDEETFKKYLGQTSYYLGLQNAVTKIARLVGATRILDLGAGTGETSFRLAETNPKASVTGVDYRESMTRIALDHKSTNELSNANFLTADMTRVWNRVQEADFVVMLYSFHHIVDPSEEKLAFLGKCYEFLAEGAHLCIAETFLPESAMEAIRSGETVRLWGARAIEAYASTFWAALGAVSEEELARSREIGRFALDHERLAGRLVEDRDEEYLVSLGWLIGAAEDVGFRVVLAEPINALGDAVVLLRRP